MSDGPHANPIETAREQIAERLRGFADFAGVEVLTRKQGDIEAKVDALLEGRLGVVTEVVIASANPKAYQTATPVLDPIRVIIETTENVLFNQDLAGGGTGKGAMFLAQRALASLQLWTPPGCDGPLMPAEPGIVPLPPDPRSPALYLTQLHLSTRATVAPRAS